MLISEEERLKREVEDIKNRIEEFNRITNLELKETESVRREQIRSRGKQSTAGSHGFDLSSNVAKE